MVNFDFWEYPKDKTKPGPDENKRKTWKTYFFKGITGNARECECGVEDGLGLVQGTP